MAKKSVVHAAIVDKSFSNLGEGHSFFVKSNATLRDRADQNMKAWFGYTIS